MKADEPINAISEEETDRVDEGIKIYTGLTTRDYIAIQAMNSITLLFLEACKKGAGEELNFNEDIFVAACYERADKMITESNK